MGESWTVNSEHSLAAFVRYVKQSYDQHKHITFKSPKIGPDRSLDQNALLHVWCTEYVAHLLRKDKREVTPGELAGMKRHAKGCFYRELHYPWMVHIVKNPVTGEEKRDYTSSKQWAKGQMYEFLTWLQMVAASDGLILESKGEYAKAQREAA